MAEPIVPSQGQKPMILHARKLAITCLFCNQKTNEILSFLHTRLLRKITCMMFMWTILYNFVRKLSNPINTLTKNYNWNTTKHQKNETPLRSQKFSKTHQLLHIIVKKLNSTSVHSSLKIQNALMVSQIQFFKTPKNVKKLIF